MEIIKARPQEGEKWDGIFLIFALDRVLNLFYFPVIAETLAFPNHPIVLDAKEREPTLPRLGSLIQEG